MWYSDMQSDNPKSGLLAIERTTQYKSMNVSKSISAIQSSSVSE